MKYAFLTREENMLAEVLDIAEMVAGAGDSADRKLTKWVQTYEEEVAHISKLTRAASVAFTRMYGEDRDLTGSDLPTTRESLIASLNIISEKAAELAEVKSKLRASETLQSSPKGMALDAELAEECRRFVNGHEIAKKAL